MAHLAGPAWPQDAPSQAEQPGADTTDARKPRRAPAATRADRQPSTSASRRAEAKTKKPSKEDTKAPPAEASPAAASAATRPAPAEQVPPAPVAPQANSAPTGEFEPVLQARAANVTTCMDKIVGLSGRVIDRPHRAVSTYVQAAPNDHVFQSIVGLNYPSKTVPNGVAMSSPRHSAATGARVKRCRSIRRPAPARPFKQV